MKKGWQAVTALALAVLCGSILAPTAAAVELDFNGIYEHPVRVAVGAVCLVAAVALLLYRVLRHPMDKARRSRSYGGDKGTRGPSMESYRRSRRKKKTPGGGVFGLLLPSYKGRKQGRSGPSVSVAAPERYRTVKRRRTPSPIRGFSNQSYKGGGSGAGSANPRTILPDSYKAPWGRKSRYGTLRLKTGSERYKGGGSAAGSTNLRAAQPDSYKAPWGSKNRYGTLRLKTGGERYKGGGSAAGSANLRTSQPDSYREPWGGKKRYGGISLPALPIPYLGRRKGADSTVKGPHTPASHTGKGILRPAPAKVTVALPERYRERFGLRRRYGMKNPRDEIPIYHGGSHVLRAARVALATPMSYREPWGSRRRYGTQTVMDWLPVYRGSVSISRSRNAYPAVPLSYREPWGTKARYGKGAIPYAVPQSHREPQGMQFRYGRGAVPCELPLSYREPWGRKFRYGRGAVPYALPQSHREPQGMKFRYGRGAVPYEMPLSYREPWGIKARYGKGAVPDELPLSYREPWGFLRRYGAGDPLERTALPLPLPYLGGSTTTAKEPWIDPDTGQLAEPVQPSGKQYGNRRYGGKLYGGRIVRYREEEPPDSSTVLHDEEELPDSNTALSGGEDGLQYAAQSNATDTKDTTDT
ncbi:MAG: hypothetical protein LUF84_02925 [Clostridiales bacterium]|nr:hypothetical protein [Clostridiales bacterium]